jgi:hypothetical protein
MNNNEVSVADDPTSKSSFTRQHSQNFEVELLRILFQQALFRKREQDFCKRWWRRRGLTGCSGA